MPTTPSGTVYTVHAFTAGGESAWRAIADSQAGASNIPTVLFCHGNPGVVQDAADQQFAAGYATLRNWLIDNGWAYIEGHGAGASWGNAAGRTAYEAMFSATAATWDLGKVIVIGRSMGALVGAWLASQSTVIAPHCAGFVSLSGTADLSNRYSTAGTTDRANLEAAYGVTGETAFRAAVTTFDPLLASTDTWVDRNAIMQWDTSDTTVPYTANGQAWDTKYGPQLSLRRTQSTSGGDHNTTPNDTTQIAATIAFLEDAELPAGIWSDTWSDTWGTSSVELEATGGLALSGTAVVAVSISRAATGTLNLTGTATPSATVTRTAPGTLTLIGGTETATSITREAAGALVLAGGASTTGGTERAADGVLGVQGAATATFTITRAATGVLNLSGQASTTSRVERTTQGALALGGVGSITFHIVRTAMGVLNLTGSGATGGRDIPDVLTLTETPVSHTLTPVTVTHTLEDR